MIFQSSSKPRNRRTGSKRRRSQNILDVNIRAHAATTQRNRKIMKWLCIAILIGSVSTGLYLGGREVLRRFFFENPEFRVTSLEIVTDGALTREEIMQCAGIHEGMNIFLVNLSQSEQRLATLPRVELAEITKIRPNRVTINITERKPVAWIAAKNSEDPSSDPSSFLVDRRGTLISGKNYLPEYLHLPIIYGVPTDNMAAGLVVDSYELRAALELVRITSETPRIQVRTIDLSKRYCMIVTDRSRAKITFGLEKIDEQLDRLAAVLQHVEASKKEIQTVNLMVQRNIPVTFGPALADSAPEAEPAAAGQKAQKPDKSKSEPAKALPVMRAKPAATPARTEAASPTTRGKENRIEPAKPVKTAPAPEQRPMDHLPVRKALPVNSTPPVIKSNHG